MKYTYFGHACFLVEIAGKKILFDPFITGNDLAKHIDIYTIEADYILVSHGHADHIMDLLKIAHNTKALVISNAEITDWVVKQGYDHVHPMNFGSKDFDFGKLHFVPAAHSSSLPDGSYGGNPGGFIVKTDDFSFYFAGDTSLTAEMTMIPYYGKLNVAILPIGGNFTMDVADATQASDLIKCDQIIGVHYDTFGYIVVDKEDALEKFKSKDKILYLPAIGESLDF